MGRPRIEEVDFHRFKSQLIKARNAGHRLEKADQPAWDEYVTEHTISEVAMSSWGTSKYEKVTPVIITQGEWAGYYVYSDIQEAALKWIRDE